MKRSKSEYNNSSEANVIYKSNDTNGMMKSKSGEFDFDTNESAQPVALPRKTSIAPVPNERKLSYGENRLIGGESLESFGTYVQEEIGPGIILEGYAVDI